MKIWKIFTKTLSTKEFNTLINMWEKGSESDKELAINVIFNSKLSFRQTRKILKYSINMKTCKGECEDITEEYMVYLFE